MIIWSVFSLVSIISGVINASKFDNEKSKDMSMKYLVHEDVIASAQVPVKFQYSKDINKLTPMVVNENDQVDAFMGILNFIDLICQEALKQPEENMKPFAVNWTNAIYELAKEIYKEHVYETADSDDDIECLNADAVNFDRETLKKSISAAELLFSPSGSSSDSSDFEGDFEPEKEYFETFILMKSKMIKESDDEKEDGKQDSDKDSEFADCNGELVENNHREHKSGSSSDEGSPIVVREAVRNLKEKGKRNRGGATRGILNANNLGLAGDLMLNMATESKYDDTVESQLGFNIGESRAGGIDTAGLMDQMQQQILEQLMAQLAERGQNNPQLAQLAQFTSVLQDERGKFEAAMGTGSDGLPEISQEGMVQFLRTSALPKLLNSAIKGKSGIDVLKSLSMILKVLNEGLGVFEVILKMLLRVTRAVRYYSLCMSDVVADMAREDNMRPMVDLSVSLDSVPMAKKSRGGKMKKLTSMFRKSTATAGGLSSDNEMSPFTAGVHASLSKSRDYATEFQKLPTTLLLRLFHTIFAELEKRNGIIRVALARKQHKTLIGMQDEITHAVEVIYEAIRAKDPEAYENLHHVPCTIITDILISLISSVKMEPAHIESHISKVTTWIKPLMVILDQENQLRILNFMLTDPNAEAAFRFTQGISGESAQKFTPKKLHFTLSRRSKQDK